MLGLMYVGVMYVWINVCWDWCMLRVVYVGTGVC